LPGDVTVPQSPYNGLSTERTGDPTDPGGTVNNLSTAATTTVTVPGDSLAGKVYVDANNDGFDEAGEAGIGGVTITLTGFDDQGNPVNAVTTTTSTGDYAFTGLRSGTYNLAESPPESRVQGKDTVGSLGGSNELPNEFTGIIVATGAQGFGYNFGVRATAGLSISGAIDDPAPNVGEVVHYTVTLQNAGPDDASNVAVAALLPAGLDYVSAAPTTGGYDPGGGVWTVAALPGGTTASLTIAATVASPDPQTLVGTITASDQVNPSLATTVSITEVPQLADLALSATVDDATPNLGDAINETLTVTNNGPDAATGLTVSGLVLPQGLVFESTTGPGIYDATMGVWTLGTLAPDSSLNLIVTARVASSAPQSITATVSAQQYDPVAGNNEASITETPHVADLALASTLSNQAPNVSDPITDTVTLTNNGPAPATAVAVSVPVPTGLTLQSVLASQGKYDATTGLWQIGTVAPGSSVTLTLGATVTSPQPQTIKAAIAHADQFDPQPANNATSATETPQQSNLVVSTSISDPHPNLGETITIATNVVNQGPDTATHVVLKSAVPPGLILIAAAPSQGSYDAAGGVWTVGSVADGASATLKLSVRVGSPADQKVASDVATVDQYNPDPTLTRSAASETIQKADLTLTAAVSALQPKVGDTVTYAVNVGNDGPDDATHIVVSAPLPAGLRLSSAVPSQGKYDPTTGLWLLGSIAAGVDPTLTITAQVTSAVPQSVTAAVSSVDQFDPNLAGATQTLTVTPLAAAQLAPATSAPIVFTPIIGTLVTGGASASGSSSNGAPSGPTAQGGQATSTLSRTQGGGNQTGARSTRTSHAAPHPHPSHHAAPHASGHAVPVIPIIPALVTPPLPVAAAAAAVHNNAAPGATGAAVAGGLPAQDVKTRHTAIPFGSSSGPQNVNATFEPNNTGAVGTTMKVITIIQAQRIWSRGQRSHHHGSRRRFR
jgi:uncharacterized repeat protein (TIGR01451 family)